MRRRVVFALLFLVFDLQFLLTPLWLRPRHHWIRPVLALALFVLGLLWAWWSSARLELPRRSHPWRWAFLSLVIIGVLNARALVSDVPWRGDEGGHIDIVVGLAGVFTSNWPIFALAALATLATGWWPRRTPAARPMLPGLALCCASFILTVTWLAFTPRAYDFQAMFSSFQITRYPWLVDWLATVPVLLVRPFAQQSPEILFRLVPFASTVLLALVCARALPNAPWPLRVLGLIAVGSIPIIFYYTSILYLEMPAILLMTVVCLHARPLLRAAPAELLRSPAWPALLLIGFIKETMAPFLFSFVACRIFFALVSARSRAERWPALVGEFRVAFCVLFPLFAYLFFRIHLSEGSRPYHPTFDNLLDSHTSPIMATAFASQFGAWMLLFAAGFVTLLWRRRWVEPLFFTMYLVAYALFQLLERDGGSYLGYSRFMLPFAPVILAGSVVALGALLASRSAAWIAGALLLGCTVVNFRLSPVHLDGSKLAGWGQYRLDTTEYYYPYRDALYYLQQHHPHQQILITGLYYPYDYLFYTAESGLVPGEAGLIVVQPCLENDARSPNSLAQSLRWARVRGFTRCLFHVMNPRLPLPADQSGFVLEKVFSNSSNELLLFTLPPDTPANPNHPAA